MIEFDMQPFEPAHNQAFADLFAQEGFERSPEYLSWIFNPPGGRGMVATARDTCAAGRVVGVLGLIPTVVECDGEPCVTHMAIDLVVDSNYRGRGIFMGLGRVALDWSVSSGARLVWGFPNQAAAHAWFNRFSWINLGTVPMMGRPLRTGYLFGKLAPSLAAVNFRLVGPSGMKAQDTRELTHFSGEVDQLWRRFAQRVDCCAVRDASYLNWRIFQRPDRSYRSVASYCDDGSMQALVCSVTEQRAGGKILFILEAMSESLEADGALSRLIQHELLIAAERGADAALCWSPPSAPNRKAYHRAGFLPVPERLRPSRSYFGLKPRHSPDSATSGSWYVSYLDLDVM